MSFGHGLHDGIQFKLVQNGDNECSSSKSIKGASASQLNGFLTNISPDKTAATLEFQPTQTARNASLCYHVTKDSGGSGAFQNYHIVPSNLVIIDIQKVTPSTLCVNHEGRLNILGSNLNENIKDQLQIISSNTNCMDITYQSNPGDVLWPNLQDEKSYQRGISFDSGFFVDMTIVNSGSNSKVCLKAHGQSLYIDTNIRVTIAASIRPTTVKNSRYDSIKPYEVALSWDLHEVTNFPVASYRIIYTPHVKCDGEEMTVTEIFPNSSVFCYDGSVFSTHFMRSQCCCFHFA